MHQSGREITCHEGEVGASGVDNTELEARKKLCLAFTKMIKFYKK